MTAKRTTLGVLLLLAILGSWTFVAHGAPRLGGSTSCQGYNFQDACRRKEVISTGATTWTASVRSYMTEAPIDTIGWSWWTARETCQGVITYQYQYGPRVVYNSINLQDWSYHRKHTCASGLRGGWSMGNHDFHEEGYPHIYPYKEYVGPL